MDLENVIKDTDYYESFKLLISKIKGFDLTIYEKKAYEIYEKYYKLINLNNSYNIKLLVQYTIKMTENYNIFKKHREENESKSIGDSLTNKMKNTLELLVIKSEKLDEKTISDLVKIFYNKEQINDSKSNVFKKLLELDSYNTIKYLAHHIYAKFSTYQEGLEKLNQIIGKNYNKIFNKIWDENVKKDSSPMSIIKYFMKFFEKPDTDRQGLEGLSKMIDTDGDIKIFNDLKNNDEMKAGGEIIENCLNDF
ncbi:hypothetical protein [Rickettsia endosymbiont of Halotydeus destructor]|uniref:hypothetical protein n=1 Tax=Rickettsia endosymbiont of Halotydeus destructor TaxID=2996754 RepID=UPI003BB19AD9